MFCPKCRAQIPDDSAFCPECGSPIKHAVRHCPWCGAPLREGATFCSSCGKRVDVGQAAPPPAASPAATTPMPAASPSTAMRQPVVPPAGSASQPVPQPPKPKKKHRGVLVAGICAAVVVAGGVGLWWYGNHAERQVSIKVEAPNYSNDATRIPLHVTGADSDGKSVDKTVYVDADGGGLSLSPGSYEATVEASPILADGSIYEVPEDPVTISVPSYNPIEAVAAVPEVIQNSVNAGGSGQSDGSADGSDAIITLTPADPARVTDEQIAAAVAAASQDPNDNGKAQSLSQVATAKRDEALASLVGNMPSNYANNALAASDGTYDYFYSKSLGGIYRAKNDGSSPEQVFADETGSETTSYCYGLNLSGDTLYFVMQTSGGRMGASIWSVGTDGSNPQQLYHLPDGDGLDWIYDLDGTYAIRQLYLYGQKLYFVLGYYVGWGGDDPEQTFELWSMDEDGSNQQKLSEFTVDGTQDIPIFMDDGRLYYAANSLDDFGSDIDSAYSSDIVSIKLDGSDETEIALYLNVEVMSLFVQDGKIYMCTRDHLDGGSPGEIMSMDLDGSNVSTLAQANDGEVFSRFFNVVDDTVYTIIYSTGESSVPLLGIYGSDVNKTTASLDLGQTLPYAICSSGDHLVVLGGGNGGGAVYSADTYSLDGEPQNTYAN